MTSRHAPSLMVTEVADGVHVLGSLKYNWYVVEQGGRFTVIDTGLPAHWPQLPGLLGTLGADLSAVEVVLLTHGHGDHAGNAERIRTETSAPVYAHPDDWAPLRSGSMPRPTLGHLNTLVRRPALRSFIMEMVRGGAMPSFPAVEELAALEDGEHLDVPGRPQVVAVPGHTLGSCALHLPEAGVVFTGDALLTYTPAAPAATNRGPRLAPDAWQEDPEQGLASLDRLEGLNAHTVLPGHGEPWTGGIEEAVQRARAIGRTR